MKNHYYKNTTTYIAILIGTGFLASQQVRADADTDLAMKLQNPIASLISVPVKLDWDTGIGATGDDRSTYLVQPVIPVSLNDKWNVISRTIVPVYIDADSPTAGGSDASGTGDILQSAFFSPKAPTASGWIWGAGPALSLPTSTEDSLGSEKFSIGPTAVVLFLLVYERKGCRKVALTSSRLSVPANDHKWLASAP